MGEEIEPAEETAFVLNEHRTVWLVKPLRGSGQVGEESAYPSSS